MRDRAAVELPQLADMRAAYDALPETMKAEIDRLLVEHVVIWDNRCTMHRGRPHDESQARDLRRATTLDTGSTLEQAA